MCIASDCNLLTGVLLPMVVDGDWYVFFKCHCGADITLSEPTFVNLVVPGPPRPQAPVATVALDSDEDAWNGLENPRARHRVELDLPRMGGQTEPTHSRRLAREEAELEAQRYRNLGYTARVVKA